jgi:hypothetical protein
VLAKFSHWALRNSSRKENNIMNKIFCCGTALALTIMLAGTLFAAEQAVKNEEKLQVAEAKLGKDVIEREIVDETSTFDLNGRVYLWLKVTGGSDDSLTVTWKHAEKSYTYILKIGGNPWRTWAYKTGAIAGGWTVTVTDSAGEVLKEMNFEVVQKPE